LPIAAESATSSVGGRSFDARINAGSRTVRNHRSATVLRRRYRAAMAEHQIILILDVAVTIVVAGAAVVLAWMRS
jgi:hypothetical protein